jgi:hypothetical protein
MTTNVDIANAALAMIGEGPKITDLDPPTGGPLATLCATLLPFARETVLEMHEWTFASRRVLLERVAVDISTVSTVTDTITTSQSHGLADNAPFLLDVMSTNGALPAPFEEDVTYYADQPSGTSLLALDAVDGDTIDITDTGTGTFRILKESDRSSWAFMYATPTDILKAVRVIPHDCYDEDFPASWVSTTAWSSRIPRYVAGRPYVVPWKRERNVGGDDVIYTQQEDADLCYTAAVTDPATFSPGFVNVLTLELASRLTRETKLRRELRQEMFVALQAAKASDASQKRVSAPDFSPWGR